HGRLWIDPVRGSVGVLIAYMLEMVLLQWTERRTQREIKTIFGRVVDPAVMEELLREDRPPELKGELRELTLLFSDLQGLTGISEILPAEQLVAFLNEYFDVMLGIVYKHGGAIDKL